MTFIYVIYELADKYVTQKIREIVLLEKSCLKNSRTLGQILTTPGRHILYSYVTAARMLKVKAEGHMRLKIRCGGLGEAVLDRVAFLVLPLTLLRSPLFKCLTLR